MIGLVPGSEKIRHIVISLESPSGLALCQYKVDHSIAFDCSHSIENSSLTLGIDANPETVGPFHFFNFSA